MDIESQFGHFENKMDTGKLAFKTATTAFAWKKKLGLVDWSEVWFWLIAILCLSSYALSYIMLGFDVHMGLLGITAALAGYKIHLLGSLQEKLDKFDEENKKLEQSVKNLEGLNETFKKTNDALRVNVDNLHTECDTLHDQVAHLSQTIADLDTIRKAMEEFAAKTSTDLGGVMDNLKATISEQKQLVKDQQVILDKTKVATKQQEKVMLLQIQSQIQYLDQSAGLSKLEYDAFVNMLPHIFREQYEKLKPTFELLDANQDGVIDIGEFQNLISQLVDSKLD